MRKKQRSRADRPPQAPTRPEAHIRRAPHRIRQGHISGTQRARPHFSSLHRTGSGMPAPQPPPSHPWSLPRAQGAATNPPPISPPPARSWRPRCVRTRRPPARGAGGRKRGGGGGASESRGPSTEAAVEEGPLAGAERGEGRRGLSGRLATAPARGMWGRPDNCRAGGGPRSGQEGGRVAIYRHALPSSTPPSPSGGGGGSRRAKA